MKAALIDSLRGARLLAPVQGSARYQLLTAVTDNRSSGFADITVTTHMQFTLIDGATRNTLLKESVATPSTVSMSDGLLYRDRIGRAMEGSVRANIRVLLDRLRHLPVTQATSLPSYP